MGALRKLRRKADKVLTDPLIVFVPDDPSKSDTYNKIVKDHPNVITVTDRAIYDKVRAAVEDAEKKQIHGARRGS